MNGAAVNAYAYITDQLAINWVQETFLHKYFGTFNASSFFSHTAFIDSWHKNDSYYSGWSLTPFLQTTTTYVRVSERVLAASKGLVSIQPLIWEPITAHMYVYKSSVLYGAWLTVMSDTEPDTPRSVYLMAVILTFPGEHLLQLKECTET